jgi:hypothetical protein
VVALVVIAWSTTAGAATPAIDAAHVRGRPVDHDRDAGTNHHSTALSRPTTRAAFILYWIGSFLLLAVALGIHVGDR